MMYVKCDIITSYLDRKNQDEGENRLEREKESVFLYEKLTQYCSSDAYPFHMPGHKRNPEIVNKMLGFGNSEHAYRDKLPYGIDITEIDGFDNLHHAEDVLLEAQKRAARLYEAAESFYLINGSTCGILASVFACTTQHGKLLMARNCHKAVYHAAELRELTTVYLYPECLKEQDKAQINGPISDKDVENALKNDPQIEAVIITSPTYDGVLSDIEKIAETAHRYGVPLIVDEAHGAHFGFHPYFPENALKKGADLVIHSLHKTLPSLTQTALLHIGKGGERRFSNLKDRIRKYLGMFETSSPSYVFMAGMDQCIRMITEDGQNLFEKYAGRLKKFWEEMGQLSHIHLLTENAGIEIDKGKLVISADGISGHDLAERLRRQYHLEMEMEAAGYVIALTSVADTEEGFGRLRNALIHINEFISTSGVEKSKKEAKQCRETEHLNQKMTISQAAACKHHTIDFENSAGEIFGEYLYVYPPGIPLAVPGEELTQNLIEQVLLLRENGLEIQGMRDYSGKKVDVCQIDNTDERK